VASARWKTLCDNTESDAYCVVDPCDADYELCETITDCSLTESSLMGLLNSYSAPVISNDYTVTQTLVASYPNYEEPLTALIVAFATLKEKSCIDTSCEAVSISIPEYNNCYALCDKTKSGFRNCEESCDITYEDFTYYVGEDCYDGCQISGTKNVVTRDVDVVKEPSINSFLSRNKFNE
jgi:hypothetical protein